MMNKKQFVNKLNSQKGITGADVILSLLMVLTAVGVISMIYFNLVIGSREVNRKTGATRIATNILENMSQVYYDEITAHLTTLSNEGIVSKHENTYTVMQNTDAKVFRTTIPNGYRVAISLENSYGDQTNGYDLVKKVNVTVNYTVSGQNKEVVMNKVFERETIRECNSPNFSEEYMRQMVPAGENYEIYSANSKSATGVKIICPVQYQQASNSYKIVTNLDALWYSYSNKQWARVLVLNPEDVEKPITDELMKGDRSYIWIPRYGIEKGKNAWGGTYFKYKATNDAILNSYYKEPKTNFIYHYLGKNFNWSETGGFTEDGILGRWCQYAEITDSTKKTVAYTLNQSQYGPMIEY